MNPLDNKPFGMLSRLQEKLPDLQVGMVPGDAFFVRKVELPEGLSSEELDAFIQLDLEGSSPFPMEALAWGYMQADDSPHAFAYATPKVRLKKLEFSGMETYYQLFPGFVSLFGDTVDKPTIRFISQTGVLSAIFLQPGQSVPEAIQSRRLIGELLTDDIQMEARDALAASMESSGYTMEDGLWLGEGVDIKNDGNIRFRHRHVVARESGDKVIHDLKVSSSSLWALDLRDASFAGTERQVRQRSSLIWKSLKTAGWIALLILITQVASFGLKGFNILMEGKIGKLEPHAVRVENKLTLAARLTQSTEEDVKPFNLMEVINPLRPDSIFFEKVRSKAFNQLEVEGKSTEGVTPVNAFADSVTQLEYVESVENNSQTRNNQTSFEFLITFSSIPPEPEGGFVIPAESDENENPEEETD
jgi:hypothetical protein